METFPDFLPWLLSAITFTAVMAATPGPNNAMVAASGATYGLARSLPHIAGVALGFPVMLVGLALGLGDLLRVVPGLQVALKWTGVAYLLWLAWRIGTADAIDPGEDASRSAPLTFLQAAMFQWVNPKAWITAVGALSAYAGEPARFQKALLLAAVFVVVGSGATLFWTLAGVGAGRLLPTGRGLRVFNLGMAALLVLSLVPVLLGD